MKSILNFTACRYPGHSPHQRPSARLMDIPPEVLLFKTLLQQSGIVHPYFPEAGFQTCIDIPIYVPFGLTVGRFGNYFNDLVALVVLNVPVWYWINLYTIDAQSLGI